MVATQAFSPYFLFIFYDFMGVSVGVVLVVWRAGLCLFRSRPHLSLPGC